MHDIAEPYSNYLFDLSQGCHSLSDLNLSPHEVEAYNRLSPLKYSSQEKLEKLLDRKSAGLSTIALFNSEGEAQKHFLEAEFVARRCEQSNFPVDELNFVVHHGMPAYRIDWVIKAINRSFSVLQENPFTIYTTLAFRPELERRIPWLTTYFRFISMLGDNGAPSEDDRVVPSVSVICLREKDPGYWLLTDQKPGTVVHPNRTPSPALVRRLQGHSARLFGTALTSYVAENNRVPEAWLNVPELANRRLLIFREDVCRIPWDYPFLPQEIIWNEQAGLIY